MPIDLVLFYVLGAVAIAASVAMIAQRNPIYSAFALIATLCALAAIYGLLGSPFIAVLQIVVYAGAIMVLFLFVLMLLSVRPEEGPSRSKSLKVAAGALVLVFAAQVTSVVTAAARGTGSATFDASTRQMALKLFSPEFTYTFLATAILILAALVGAVVLAKK